MFAGRWGGGITQDFGTLSAPPRSSSNQQHPGLAVAL
jgi:hypothetical protein